VDDDIKLYTPVSMPPGSIPFVALPDGAKKELLGSGYITRLLGEGGMANVYEIWNPQLEVFHAVKLIKPTCSRESLERFQTEIKICAKLHHPNIIEIYSVGAWNELPYIEMEKIVGVTLKDLLETRGALPIPVCSAVAIMVGRALKYAHNHEYVLYGKTYQGIIHRDLKPENVMICADGAVKLMDFGIARPTDTSFHTIEGYVVGTLQYLSPEQLNGEALDIRSDIYSLGTTIYEMITGAPAFGEQNIHKLIRNKSGNHYRQVNEFNVNVPPRLQRLVSQCMEYNKQRRPASMENLLAELDHIHGGRSPEETMLHFMGIEVKTKVVITTRNRIPPSLIPAAAGCILFLLAGFGSILLRPRPVAPALPTPTQSAPELPRTADTLIATQSPKPAPETRPRVTPRPPATVKPLRSAPADAEVSAKTMQTTPLSPATKHPTALDKLREKHGSVDLLTILEKESLSGNHAMVLAVFDSLTPDQAAKKSACLCKLRALAALSRNSELAEYAAANPVDDAEYWLIRAKLAIRQKKIAEAEQLLEKSLIAPREFMDYSALKQYVYYYQALCATYTFDQQPTETNWSTASGAWYRLKNEMRSNRNHEYYREAERELTRIGDKIHAGGN
jgi:serine/threonine protein kinase